MARYLPVSARISLNETLGLVRHPSEPICTERLARAQRAGSWSLISEQAHPEHDPGHSHDPFVPDTELPIGHEGRTGGQHPDDEPIPQDLQDISTAEYGGLCKTGRLRRYGCGAGKAKRRADGRPPGAGYHQTAQ